MLLQTVPTLKCHANAHTTIILYQTFSRTIQMAGINGCNISHVSKVRSGQTKMKHFISNRFFLIPKSEFLSGWFWN